MTQVQAALLGLVQGLTEFLPVSSSGHLVLAQALLGVDSPGILLELTTHLATLLAIVVYFRRRLRTLLRAVPSLLEVRRSIFGERSIGS